MSGGSGYCCRRNHRSISGWGCEFIRVYYVIKFYLPLIVTMLLLIDNYDSFTYNLVQAFGTIDPGLEVRVVRNDQVTVSDIEELGPSHIVLSPGPCTPDEAGICNEVIPVFRGRVPILGVCLGHQCIGQVHGMKIVRAEKIMHGKTSEIYHDGRGLFAGIANPFTATRYHSLIIDRESFNDDEFEISAWTDDDVIMGIRWKGGDGVGEPACMIGVQFHPESFLTPDGPLLLEHFLQFNHVWSR